MSGPSYSSKQPLKEEEKNAAAKLKDAQGPNLTFKLEKAWGKRPNPLYECAPKVPDNMWDTINIPIEMQTATVEIIIDDTVGNWESHTIIRESDAPDEPESELTYDPETPDEFDEF